MKILVGIPLGNSVPDVSFLALWQIANRGYPIIDSGYARTDVHRNEFAQVLLDSDYTHLAMLDTDHVHTPDTIERLARWAKSDEDKFKIVAGLNFRRGVPFDPLAFMRGDDGQYHAIAEWPDGLFKVDVVGPGAILIHRSVFEAIDWPWWVYEYVDGKHPTEDVYFCHKARAAGFDIWVDGTLTSPHLITDAVNGDRFKAWLAANPDKIMP